MRTAFEGVQRALHAFARRFVNRGFGFHTRDIFLNHLQVGEGFGAKDLPQLGVVIPISIIAVGGIGETVSLIFAVGFGQLRNFIFVAEFNLFIDTDVVQLDMIFECHQRGSFLFDFEGGNSLAVIQLNDRQVA